MSSQLVTLDVTLDGQDAYEFVQAVRDLTGPAGTVSVSLPQAHRLRIFPQSRIVLRGTQELDLTRLEFDLLYFLAEHPLQVFRRSQLLSQVWKHTYAGTRTVDVHVRRLRAKAGPEVVTTVRGVGYRLDHTAAVQIVPPQANAESF